MNIQNKSRNHDAVYWPIVKDERGVPMAREDGTPRYDAPIHLNPLDGTGVFWIESEQLIGVGNVQKQSRATVIVDREMSEGGFLWRGTLDDLPDGLETLPKDIYGAYEILRQDRFANVRNTTTVFIVYL